MGPINDSTNDKLQNDSADGGQQHQLLTNSWLMSHILYLVYCVQNMCLKWFGISAFRPAYICVYH